MHASDVLLFSLVTLCSESPQIQALLRQIETSQTSNPGTMKEMGRFHWCLHIHQWHLSDQEPQGNSKKIWMTFRGTKLRLSFFSEIVMAGWNSPPDDVVTAPSATCFKTHLDAYWKNLLSSFELNSLYSYVIPHMQQWMLKMVNRSMTSIVTDECSSSRVTEILYHHPEEFWRR